MLKVEIVSHCWRYSRALLYQLSSLYLFPPRRVAVTMTVFCSEEDQHTMEVLEFFASQPAPPGLILRPWKLPSNLVKRRMIGRNLAALATSADWVWFTDCDYLFRGGCLDFLAKRVRRREEPLLFPRYAHMSRTHEHGDEELRRPGSELRVLDIRPEAFCRTRFNRAVGGVQIARGEIVRQMGYCRDSPLQQVPTESWVLCTDDIWFRKLLKTRGRPIRLPNVFRIRHSSRGGALLDGESGDVHQIAKDHP